MPPFRNFNEAELPGEVSEQLIREARNSTLSSMIEELLANPESYAKLEPTPPEFYKTYGDVLLNREYKNILLYSYEGSDDFSDIFTELDFVARYAVYAFQVYECNYEDNCHLNIALDFEYSMKNRGYLRKDFRTNPAFIQTIEDLFVDEVNEKGTHFWRSKNNLTNWAWVTAIDNNYVGYPDTHIISWDQEDNYIGEVLFYDSNLLIFDQIEEIVPEELSNESLVNYVNFWKGLLTQNNESNEDSEG